MRIVNDAMNLLAHFDCWGVTVGTWADLVEVTPLPFDAHSCNARVCTCVQKNQGNIYGSVPWARTVGRTLLGGGTAPDVQTTNLEQAFGNTTITLDGPGKVLAVTNVTYQPLPRSCLWIGTSLRAVQGGVTIGAGEHTFDDF